MDKKLHARLNVRGNCLSMLVFKLNHANKSVVGALQTLQFCDNAVLLYLGLY